MNRSKNELVSLLENIPLFLIAGFFVLFPLLFSVSTTEAFILPKQFLLGAIVTVSTLFLALRIFVEGKIRLRTTPFDVPVLLFAIAVFVSAFLSVNRYDALIAAIPFMYGALLFFVIVNTVKGEKALFFLIASLLVGGMIAAIISIFAFFNLHLLPLPYTKSPYFSTFGTLFDQAMYVTLLLPMSGYFVFQFLSSLATKNKGAVVTVNGKTIFFLVSFFILFIALLTTLYHLLTTQKPIILPFTDGFQIAFATISQDAGRILKSFLFGSGYGTFLTDFTRFRQPSYNAYDALWSVTFLRSSSFVLELLATTGIIGVVTFFFIIFRVIREKTVFIPLILAIVAAFLFPFSPIMVTIFFVLLSLFTVVRSHSNAQGYGNAEIHLVAMREGLFEAVETHEHTPARRATGFNKVLPGLFALTLAGLVGFAGYYAVLFAMSDMIFQKSLVAAASNNGTQTYNLQRQAIRTFPFRDSYHRVFSQTNLALANSLAAQTPQGSSPSAQTQQNVLTLIQQSINTGRAATSISPYTAMNWNNLSGIYRAMVGFGQNAEQFAVLTNRQAIALDPSNPQQYVNLGGIYYQLGLWDDATRQFQIAINLKDDFSNAYYNLGHALEAKGNKQQALAVYQIVRNLVSSDKENAQKIEAEMAALKKQIEEQPQDVAGAQTTQPADTTPTPTPTTGSSALNVNTKPANTLPTRNPKAPIEGPTISPIPSPTGTR